ncbi:hypothetical protein BH23ACT10_BH23ACT10_25010 [soil metagenome]
MGTGPLRQKPEPLISDGLRALFAIAAGLEILAGVSLYIFADRTADWFAWTLEPPLTAAFLGAVYWATLGPVLYAVIDRRWVRARAAVPSTLAFAVPLVFATAAHLDRFHFAGPGVNARFAAWLWLAVYVAVPPALSILAYHQERTSTLPARHDDLPAGIRGGLWLVSLTCLPIGVTLFTIPSATVALWPWSLTPLAARAVASGLLGIGVGALYGAVQNDRERAILAFPSLAAFGVLQLLASLRFAGDVEWSRLSAWLHVTFLVGLVAVGVLGMTARPRAEP